jgi:homocysteine S-methyltransferase
MRAMPKGILERLAEGPVLGDGGYLLELEKRGYVQAGPFTPEMVVEHPDALAQLHREFLRAGVDVLQTMTFYASEDKLSTVGMQGKVDEINRTAVRVAREVAAEGDARGLTTPPTPPHPSTSARCWTASSRIRPTPALPTSGSARPSPTSARRSCSSSAPSRPGSP